MLDKLPVQDKELIYNYIKQNTGAREEIADIDYILRFWDKEKKPLYEKMGDFILEKKIDYKLDPVSELETYFDNYYYYYSVLLELMAFLKEYGAEDLASINTVAKQKYSGKTIKIKCKKSDKYIQINNGCKPFKILQKINNEFNIIEKDKFNNFVNKVSEILGKKTIEGTMCLSIHPLDFMTMSDNSNDWSSCMSWDSGEYKMGTVEMMNSPFVIVGYLKSDSKHYFNWNSKRWRELYIVDIKHQLISNIKSYPYRCDTLSENNVKWLQDIFFPNNIVVKNKNIIIPVTKFMYNDLLYPYTIYNSVHEGYDPSEKITINYSGVAECMCCGSTEERLDEYSVLCPDCEGTTVCDICGNRMYEDDLGYYDPAREIKCCGNCYDDYYKKCAISQNIYHEDDMYEVDLYTNDNYSYDSFYKTFYIYKDYAETFIEKYFGEDSVTYEINNNTQILKIVCEKKFTTSDLLKKKGINAYAYCF